MFSCCCAAGGDEVGPDVVSSQSTFAAVSVPEKEVNFEAKVEEAAPSGGSPPARKPSKSRTAALPEAQEFTVVLEKSKPDMKVGLDVLQRGKLLFVKNIKEGMITEWNKANPNLEVRSGDRITAINDCSGSAKELLERIATDSTLNITLFREEGLALRRQTS